MGVVHAGAYSANMRPYQQGTSTVPEGQRMIPGAVGPSSQCADTNKKGDPCGASPANGTELCVGHLRKAGRL
jgi:hypothetical protein